jgi:hypothetical protein
MPYSKLSDVPASLRGIEPPVTLAQANGVAECADALKDKPGIESPWAVCINQFKTVTHRVEGGKWVEREEGKAMETVEIDGAEVRLEELVAAYKALSPSLDEMTRRVRDAWYVQFRRDTFPPQPTTGVDAWVKEVYEDKIIIEAEGGLFAYPYAVTDDGIEFGEPVKVEVEYRPVSSKALAVKALREEDGGVVVGGPLLLFGDARHRDLQKEYFTPDTWLGLDEYKSVPALFHHGLDQEVGLAVIGHRVKAEVRDTGVWVEDWLDTSGKYWQMVKPLLDAEALYYSPGSAPHLVKRHSDGRLESFPVIEDTLTPIPAQFRLLPVDQVKAAYKAAGLDLPRLDEGGESAGADCRKAEAEKAQVEIELALQEIELAEVNQ